MKLKISAKKFISLVLAFVICTAIVVPVQARSQVITDSITIYLPNMGELTATMTGVHDYYIIGGAGGSRFFFETPGGVSFNQDVTLTGFNVPSPIYLSAGEMHEVIPGDHFIVSDCLNYSATFSLLRSHPQRSRFESVQHFAFSPGWETAPLSQLTSSTQQPMPTPEPPVPQQPPTVEQPTTHKIYARNSMRVITERNLGWYLINSSSTVYCPIIAEMGAGFSDSIYDETLIRLSLESHGFHPDNITTRHTMGFAPARPSHAIAYKYVEGSRIVAVIIRGSQWGDFSESLVVYPLGTQYNASVHLGYQTGMSFIFDQITEMLGENWWSCNRTTYFITGHSYGGAMANLLAREIERIHEVPRSRIFAYTFASPRVAFDRTHVHPRANWTHEYTNIFNIINREDSWANWPWSWDGLGNGVWHRFGRYLTFSISDNAHNMNTTYLPFMQRRTILQTYDSHYIRLIRVNSPVDIAIIDTNYNIIGTIVDGVVWHSEYFWVVLH